MSLLALTSLVPEPFRVQVALLLGVLWIPWAWISILTSLERHPYQLIALVTDAAALSLSWAVIDQTRTQVFILALAMAAAHIATALMSYIQRQNNKASALAMVGEQRLAILLTQMPIALWTTDEALTCTSQVGGALSGLLGQGRSVLGLSDMSHEWDGAHRLAMKGEPTDFEISWNDRTYQVFVRTLRDGAERSLGAVGAALDVTDRKLAEEAKTLFLATASHELKTPLTVIKGFSHTLLRAQGMLDPAISEKALSAIERRADQLNVIVEGLLLSSRIESGRASVSLSAIQPIETILDRAEALQDATGRQLVVTSEPDPPEAWADPAALVTIIDHLFDNALKYSPEGGSVKVLVTSDAASIVIRVSDQGIGMDEEQAEHCFDKFWQGDRKDSRKFGGTGIGLYIVKSLCDAMGGSINADTKLGVGTVFEVRLPRADADRTVTDETRVPEGESSVIREFMHQIGVSAGGGGG